MAVAILTAVYPRQKGPLRPHLGPLLLLAVLTCVWTWPLILHLKTHLPGEAITCSLRSASVSSTIHTPRSPPCWVRRCCGLCLPQKPKTSSSLTGRLPPAYSERYAQMPLVGNLLRLSTGELPLLEAPGGSLSCRYLVVHQDTAPAPAVEYVHSKLTLQWLDGDGHVDLYRIDGMRR